MTFPALQVCMVCSAGYHMFHCQSENATRRWLGLDLAGVSVGLCGCYFPGAYYAFYCDRVCIAYVCVYTVMTQSWVQQIRQFSNRPYSHRLLTVNNYVNCPSNFAFARSIYLFHPPILRKSLCETVYTDSTSHLLQRFDPVWIFIMQIQF